jgi:plastocyanin
MRLRTFRTWAVLGAELMAGLLVGGCHEGGGGGASVPPVSMPADHAAAQTPAARVVGIDNFSFDPQVITVPVGATVTWVNHDDVPHTATSVDKRFASPTLDTDGRFSQTFAAAGAYDYYCAVHPHMTGKVIVK